MTTPQQPTEHELLIEAVALRRGRLLRRQHRYPVQNIPFELVLRVTNRGELPFPGATIAGLTMHAGGGGVVHHVWSSQFAIGALNPGDTKELQVGSMTSPLEGPVWVECRIVPNDNSYVVNTHQRDPATGGITKYSRQNSWGNGWFLQRQMEHQQARTNLILLVLAALTLLEGIVGLKTIATAIVRWLGNMLLWLGHALGAT